MQDSEENIYMPDSMPDSLPNSGSDDFKGYETRMVEMVFPTQTNHYGTLFGGQALSLMDRSAFITATRYSRQAMVTASSERVDFKAPVKQGQLVEAVGRIKSVGKSSITVEVELWAEELLTGVVHLSARGQFVLVAVDQVNRPVPITVKNTEKLPVATA
jgi:acyl-CoA hydrolase